MSKPHKFTGSKLERQFALYWMAVDGPVLDREVRFHKDRKWQFDFAHEGARVAIELEGGAWTGGRHTSGKGFRNDCQKYNAATLAGWRVFRLTVDMIRIETLRPIKAAILQTPSPER